jgi:hypothetical protein
MRTTMLGWLLVFLLSLTVAQAPASEETVRISAPGNNEVLQGVLTINGSTTVSTFASGELQFSYNKTPKTWFLIQSLEQPVLDGKLAAWDTNSVTDGVYDLRLVVIMKDGSQKEAFISGLRIRNYTPIETRTPTLPPVVPVATPVPNRHTYSKYGYAPTHKFGWIERFRVWIKPDSRWNHRFHCIRYRRGLSGY